MTTVILHLSGWFLLWVVCGYIAYRFTLANFLKRYPLACEADVQDYRHVALVTGLAGYIGLGVAYGFWRELKRSKQQK